jgi:2-polyprenyl-6-methoxyphenol hydroxylase-like FAD-dependent oxidoreductase
MYDAIVVGARCGGASTAMLLARKGLNVLLVDRSTFPSDIAHGHFIHRGGPRTLHRWGLLDRVLAINSPAVTRMTTNYGDVAVTGEDLIVDGVPAGLAPRRSAIDHVLVKAAIEAGAEFRDGFIVEEFTAAGDRITGIKGRDRIGTAATIEQATVIIGADGRHSRLARTVDAPKYEVAPTVTGSFFSYWSGMENAGLEIYVKGRTAIFSFPTNDGLTAIFVFWASEDLHDVRGDIEGKFMAVIDQIPELADRVRNAHREERFYGALDLPNFSRKPFGPGWALVGDAGCHKDPFLALGMCDGFRDAELLANALADAFEGREPFDAALAAYELKRNEATLPDYRMNLRMAQFKPMPDDAVAIRRAVRADQRAANQYYLAMEGLIPRESFFNPDNLQNLMAVAAR